MNTAKLVDKRNIQANAPAVIAGKNVKAGRDVIVNAVPVGKTDAQIARDLMIFMDDRRVLFNSHSSEVPHHVTMSIDEIRKYLTKLTKQTQPGSDLERDLTAIRSACRELMDMSYLPHAESFGRDRALLFGLDKFRANVIPILARISEQYGVYAEKDLAASFLRYKLDR